MYYIYNTYIHILGVLCMVVVVGVGPICHSLLLTRQESTVSFKSKLWLCGEFLSVGVRVSHQARSAVSMIV